MFDDWHYSKQIWWVLQMKINTIIFNEISRYVVAIIDKVRTSLLHWNTEMHVVLSVATQASWFIIKGCEMITMSQQYMSRQFYRTSEEIHLAVSELCLSLCLDQPPDPQPATKNGMAISLIASFMGTTWGSSGANRTQVGPMLALWPLQSGTPPVGRGQANGVFISL